MKKLKAKKETMRGRVGALIALGAGFNPILTGREPEGWQACRASNRRLAQRVQRRREGANQNISINGSVLGFTKKKIDAKIYEIIDFAHDSFAGAYAEGQSTGKIKCSKGIEHY